MITALLVLLCSGCGAVARFVADSVVQSPRLSEFPLGTLVVNVGGSFLLGLLAGLDLPKQSMTLLGTATLGSYTTFSTWMLETHRPAEDGEPALAWLNVTVSLATGLVAIELGRLLGGAL